MEHKPRKWWVAGLLSLLEPGLGQIYNGQWRKGLFFIMLPSVMVPVLTLSPDSANLAACLAVLVLCEVIYYAYVVGDAVIHARRAGSSYELRKYNRVVVYIGVVAICMTYSSTTKLVLRENCFQSYQIPAGSMEPTLLIGDCIVADRRPTARNPERGHLVIFESPEDSTKDFIKRVVAVGGDTVMIRNKCLFINGQPAKEQYVVHQEAEILPAERNPRDNFGPVTVPAGSYFVLGDNRDRSYDSRFWGFVDKLKVKGVVRNIYWSWDRDKNQVRWDRIGGKIL